MLQTRSDRLHDLMLKLAGVGGRGPEPGLLKQVPLGRQRRR